ncbi:DUF3223 domain-containing protein [Propionibacterium freudenreichii]|uniref:DUF3223 domain-containing protein n=1 Tax=Propionibacterium freudenreichii TaxID=1744 RepID=UPI003852B8F3
MGARKPVNLPSKQFPSRKAAKDWVRDEIKDHYGLEEVVTDPLHVAVLFDLLDRDDDADEKVGAGVAEFFIRLTSLGQGHIRYVKSDARGIWIRRVDGSEDDWSYTSAIDQEGIKSDVKDALRAVINDERLAFRDSAFNAGPVYCDRTGKLIASLQDAEVRYKDPSWAQLTESFAKELGGWDKILLTAGEGRTQISGSLADAHQLQAWKSYWHQHARPILVAKSVR